MKSEKLFTICRFYIAPISVIFSFFFLHYITMIILGIILLMLLFGIFDYSPTKDERRNFIGALLFIMLSVVLSIYFSKLPLVHLFNLIIILVFIYLTDVIMKKNNWSNPFMKKAKK